jgi:cytosine/adenosine deaminase-related metal-dependent hydrolase
MRAWGCSAVAALDRRGLLSDRSLLVHCGFCDDWDLDRIAERRASVALCPISSEFLNTRMPDVRKLDERGIPWVLCSDGTATGRTVSLIDQALTLKQHQPWVEYADIFEAMTVRPARFYGKAYYTGRIDGVSRAKCLCAKWRGAVGAGFLDALFGKRLEISYSDAPEVP